MIERAPHRAGVAVPLALVRVPQVGVRVDLQHADALVPLGCGFCTIGDVIECSPPRCDQELAGVENLAGDAIDLFHRRFHRADRQVRPRAS